MAPPPPCPYKHFPLKEGEAVQYADIKWELVQPKFAEISAKLASDPDATTAAAALGQTELAEIDALVGVLKQKQNYHSTTLGGPQLAALNKMLRQWPRESFGPVANLLRLAALHPSAAKFWAGESASKGGADMVSPLLLRAAQAEKPVAAMLVVRALVNGFARRALARALAARHEEVIEAVAELYKKSEKCTRAALPGRAESAGKRGRPSTLLWPPLLDQHQCEDRLAALTGRFFVVVFILSFFFLFLFFFSPPLGFVRAGSTTRICACRAWRSLSTTVSTPSSQRRRADGFPLALWLARPSDAPHPVSFLVGFFFFVVVFAVIFLVFFSNFFLPQPFF